MQEETAKVEEHLLEGSFTSGIIKCFTTAKANAFENLLEPLQKLLRLSPAIAQNLAHPDLFYRILQKVQSNKAVVRLNLLRIIRSICDASEEQGLLISQYGLTDAIQRLADSDGAVLVRNMASELILSSELGDKMGIGNGLRRPMRRSSSSNTPPSAFSSYSMPSTPTTGRSGRSTNYLFDRETRPRPGVGNALPYRPVSRDRSSISKLPTMVTTSGAAGKSQLPRTSLARTPQRQVVVSPRKEENIAPSTSRPDSAGVATPHSRRRRRISETNGS